MDERLFQYLAAVPVLGVFAQWLAWRIKLPSILVLLLFGIILGRIVKIDDLLVPTSEASSTEASRLLFPFVSLSVAVIMFEGGLSLRLRELRDSGRAVLHMVTIGAVVSWILTALIAWLILGLDHRLAILLGAILVVTGPTVVQPLLRHIRPTRRVAALVKWEGIVIDPVGAMLAVLVFEELLNPERLQVSAEGWHASTELLSAAQLILATLGVGSVIGVGLGVVLIWGVSRFLIPDHLYGVVFLAAAFLSFAVSNYFVHESGLVAVTILGILLANQRRISMEQVIEFKEHLGVFLISCLFIVLGSRLDLSEIAELGWRGVAFLAAMILLVRPLSVAVGCIGTRLPYRERLFLAGLAPRGIVAAAVTSIFALRIASDPQLAQVSPELVEQAARLVPATFLVIIGTVLVYGLTAAPLARRLRLADDAPQGLLIAGAETWIQQFAKTIMKSGVAVKLVDTNYRNVANARMNGIPAHCANVLSEEVREGIDLAGIGRLLAMTGNDEVNVLATREFAHWFGRANVYALPPNNQSSGLRAAALHRRGRELFGEGLNQRAIATLVEQGYEMRATSITETYTYQDFLASQGETGYALVWIDSQKRLTLATNKQPLKPQGRGTLISLLPSKNRGPEKSSGSDSSPLPDSNPNVSPTDQDSQESQASRRLDPQH